MQFISQAYLLLLAGVLAVYWGVKNARARVWILVIASMGFYAAWNHLLALLITATTVMDFLVARGMEERERSEKSRKLLFAISLAVNIGVLVYFKYANFFLHSLEDFLRAMGASASLPTLKVLLPIGISFYTFEAINYTVDVYKRRIPAEKNLGNFMLFILFFPHLISGPIVRARDFLPQTHRKKHFDWGRFEVGAGYFIMGLLKKMLIADRMAAYVEPVFNDPCAYSTGAIWIAVIAYAVQIYCDFSGYTDMAIGSAHFFGYKLAENFDMPYLARNVAQFWRHWHVSLSSWLRDYVFISLGGSRGGFVRTARNLMLTMIIGGFWHGANWTFIVWGYWHGMLLVLNRFWRGTFPENGEKKSTTIFGGAIGMALTLLCVLIGWVFFRAEDVGTALVMLQRMFAGGSGLGPPMSLQPFYVLLAAVAVAHVFGKFKLWKKASDILPAPAVGGCYASALIAAQVLAPGAPAQFIYFQF